MRGGNTVPRFFVPPSQIYDDEIVILGDDARHIISSLRMREGEEITVCDMNRRDYFCRISTAFDAFARHGRTFARVAGKQLV